jgi:hypothetical protein
VKADSGRNAEFYVVKHGKRVKEEKSGKRVPVYSFESCVFPVCFLGFYRDGTAMAPRMAEMNNKAAQFVIEVPKK